MNRIFLSLAAAGMCVWLVCGQQAPQQQAPQQLTPEQQQLVDTALPAKAPAKPKKPRRLLVTSFAKVNGRITRGHPSIPAANYAIEQMGKRTGAYEAVVSNDIEMFRPDKIKQFDA